MDNTVKKLQETLIKVLKNNGIKNHNVLEAFHNICRYDFIKDYVSNEKDLYDAYFNPFPIGFEQTISQPLICAIMLESLQVEADDILLEIGTGSGYLTAIIAQLAKEVYTVEINDVLLSQARKRLDALNLKNVRYYLGNGLLGIKDILFDKIIISAAITELPETLINSLKVGGILVAPLQSEENSENQKLVKIIKTDEKIVHQFICYCRFVPIQKDIHN